MVSDAQNEDRPFPQFVGGQSIERSPLVFAVRTLLQPTATASIVR